MGGSRANEQCVFDALEEQETLKAPVSLHLIFVIEQKAPRCLLDQDLFKDLPNAVIVRDNGELAVVPFAGDAAGAVLGAGGCSGGVGGKGGLVCVDRSGGSGSADGSGGAGGSDGPGT